MGDTIKIAILDDGTIKVDTDRVSMPNHTNADGFVRDIGRMAGGKVERKHKHGHHEHSHEHTHEHHEH